jgi:thiamine biosynthesis lipoprotein
MSSWIERSEISQLNAAPANQRVHLSAETIAVLRAARQATADTRGAFDVTCRPVVELWRQAGKAGRLPEDRAVNSAKAASNWSHFKLDDNVALKTTATAQIDLGGIAKGYAIDRAVEAMRSCGVAGGMVDVGGDVRCFGRPADSDQWKAQIRDPFGGGVLGEFTLGEGAVCTSGDYARFAEIEGRRYSHIIDPRTGWPATAASAATVVAPDALTADSWATALAVDGREGLDGLPAGADALLICGSHESPLRAGTDRFKRLISPTPSNR